MTKRSRSKKTVKVADLSAKGADPKGGTDCEGYASLSTQLLGDGSVRTTSPTTTTTLKANKN